MGCLKNRATISWPLIFWILAFLKAPRRPPIVLTGSSSEVLIKSVMKTNFNNRVIATLSQFLSANRLLARSQHDSHVKSKQICRNISFSILDNGLTKFSTH